MGNRSSRKGGEGSGREKSSTKLNDLPDAILTGVSAYLPRTSCVSFAYALRAQHHWISTHEPSETSIAILAHHNWDSIDFNEIQQVCGRPLTDDDIRWVLQSIDAPKKIKSLKLTHCIGITGTGLRPLRGSSVLERIDLSLVSTHESPTIDPEPVISASLVVPILESILRNPDNSLVHVQLGTQEMACWC